MDWRWRREDGTKSPTSERSCSRFWEMKSRSCRSFPRDLRAIKSISYYLFWDTRLLTLSRVQVGSSWQVLARSGCDVTLPQYLWSVFFLLSWCSCRPEPLVPRTHLPFPGGFKTQDITQHGKKHGVFRFRKKKKKKKHLAVKKHGDTAVWRSPSFWRHHPHPH